jgi:uncharacterized membrane protein
VSRYLVLYLMTLAVLAALDFPFLGIVAKGFFAGEVGDMLGEIRPGPAVLFYLLYVAGVLTFVSGPASATRPSTLVYGAPFGLFCYATLYFTALALLKHWTWAVGVVDVSWGAAATAIAASAGLIVVNAIVPKV